MGKRPQIIRILDSFWYFCYLFFSFCIFIVSLFAELNVLHGPHHVSESTNIYFIVLERRSEKEGECEITNLVNEAKVVHDEVNNLRIGLAMLAVFGSLLPDLVIKSTIVGEAKKQDKLSASRRKEEEKKKKEKEKKKKISVATYFHR